MLTPSPAVPSARRRHVSRPRRKRPGKRPETLSRAGVLYPGSLFSNSFLSLAGGSFCPPVPSGQKVLSLLGETGTQILEGYTFERGELKVLKHPGQDATSSEFYPLFDSHSGQGFDDPDPPDRCDHLTH